MPHCAPLHETSAHSSAHLLSQYNYLWSLTGYPVGMIPVTTVAEDEQTFVDSHDDKWTKMLGLDA